ncbi:tetratricopeptide repeat protein, partial [Candidatus Omnitrophota bacterium]
REKARQRRAKETAEKKRQKQLAKERELERRIDFHLAQGRYYLSRQDYALAKKECDKALVLDYQNKRAKKYLNKIAKAMEAEARQEVLAKKSKLEKKVSVHLDQGKAYLLEVDYQNAIRKFSQVLVLDQDNKQAQKYLNKIAKAIEAEAQVKKQTLAQRREQERLEKERQRQENINQHLAQGKIYFHQGKHQEAIAEFGKILFFDPEHADAEQYMLRSKQVFSRDKPQQQLDQKTVQEQRQREQVQTKLLEGQMTKLKQVLEEYEQALEEKLAQKEVVSSPRFAKFESRATQLEEEKQKIELEIVREEAELKMAQQEREKLETELGQLRQEQEQSIIEEWQKYQVSFQNEFERLTQKEAELEQKIKDYEAKIEQLQMFPSVAVVAPAARGVEYEPQYLVGDAEAADGLKEKAAPADSVETIMLKLKMEQLHNQVEGLMQEKAKPFYERGRTHLKKERYAQARDDLEQALAIYPNYTQAQRAIDAIEQVEKIEIHLSEGKFYYGEKNYQKAKQEFTNALELDYKHREARKYLRRIEKALKDGKSGPREKRRSVSSRETRELEQKRLKDIKDFYEKGKFYFGQGLYQEAVVCFEKVIELEKQ